MVLFVYFILAKIYSFVKLFYYKFIPNKSKKTAIQAISSMRLLQALSQSLSSNLSVDERQKQCRALPPPKHSDTWHQPNV